jgi:hypothetical protein
MPSSKLRFNLEEMKQSFHLRKEVSLLVLVIAEKETKYKVFVHRNTEQSCYDVAQKVLVN